MIIRLAVYLIALVFVLSVVALISDLVRGWMRGRSSSAARTATRTPRANCSLRRPSPSEPSENRERIVHFVDTRAGVEAFVEPQTMMHPLSVVLVAEDGEWIRVALRDDRFLRELAQVKRLPVHDAMQTGYPERMRTFRRPPPSDEDEPG
jgi:hypothetical protein